LIAAFRLDAEISLFPHGKAQTSIPFLSLRLGAFARHHFQAATLP